MKYCTFLVLRLCCFLFSLSILTVVLYPFLQEKDDDAGLTMSECCAMFEQQPSFAMCLDWQHVAW